MVIVRVNRHSEIKPFLLTRLDICRLDSCLKMIKVYNYFIILPTQALNVEFHWIIIIMCFVQQPTMHCYNYTCLFSLNLLHGYYMAIIGWYKIKTFQI